MGKVVKVLGVIAGVAAIVATGGLGAGLAAAVTGALGMGAATIGLIATGLTISSSLLSKRPKAPKTSPEALDRLNASIDPRTPRKMVFGITAGRTSFL